MNYKNKCKHCPNHVRSGRSICDECKEKRSKRTISDILCKGYPRCVVNNRVREEARKVVRDLGWKSCRGCGYSKHIEVCHINPIANFSEDTPLDVVNHPDNLLPLCPNCHWEFDNDGLEVDGHRKTPSRRKRSIGKHKCRIDGCDSLVIAKGSACRQCVAKSNLGKNQKTVWLELDELIHLIEETSLSSVARKLGVTPNAVKKHIERLKKHNKVGRGGIEP